MSRARHPSSPVRFAACSAAAAVVIALTPAAAIAEAPQRIEQTAGGGFTNPCNGNFVTYELTQTILLLDGQLLQASATGTAVDTVTGTEYTVLDHRFTSGDIFNVGSWRGGSTTVFVAINGGGTITIHDFALVNTDTDPPIIVPNHVTITC
jgi:hypothetical protein